MVNLMFMKDIDIDMKLIQNILINLWIMDLFLLELIFKKRFQE
jgi:hypothetical protein